MAKRDLLKDLDQVAKEHARGALGVVLDAMYGVKLILGIGAKPPKGGKSLGKAGPLQKAPDGEVLRCKHCKRAWYEAPAEIEVYQVAPDPSLAKYVLDQVLGKAKTREETTIDPEINIIVPPGVRATPEPRRKNAIYKDRNEQKRASYARKKAALAALEAAKRNGS